MTKRWTATKSGVMPKRLASKRGRARPPTEATSWWCQPCSQESYTVRCKYCGKTEAVETLNRFS